MSADREKRQKNGRNVVKDGGIAGSDAEVADVGRDTSGAAIGEGGTGPTAPPPKSPDYRKADDQLSEALEEQKDE